MLMTSFGGHCPSTSWVRSRKLSTLLGLYAVHVCCCCIQAINMAFVPEKPPFLAILAQWRHFGGRFPPSSWAKNTKLGAQTGHIVPY